MMRQTMEKQKTLERTRADYKDMRAFLKRHDLVDDRDLWIAGYHDLEASGYHPIARNLFYGNRKLEVLSVHGEDLWFMKNTRKGFDVYHLGKCGDIHRSVYHRHLLWPSLRVVTDDSEVTIRATKNKPNVKKLHTLLK